jgi:hypothetical protein
MALWFRGDRKNFQNYGFRNKVSPRIFEMLTSWSIKWPCHILARVGNIFKNVTINVKFETIAVGEKIILKYFKYRI